MHPHHRVIIIGSGPAGYTAALYTTRANLKPLQFLGSQPGGQLTITTEVENYPGFRDPIQGPWLMEEMRAQVERLGTTMLFEDVARVDLSKRPFVVESETGDHYTADALIISTGAKAKWLGIESEKKFLGYGVSGCATCDGFFFKGKNVAVVGGGNTAVEEALYLTHHADHVTLIHRRDSLRADQINQERLLNHPKITVLWNHHVKEILGEENPKNMTGLLVEHTQTKELTTLLIDGLFVAIGHTPMSDFLKGQVDMDSIGYIQTEKGSTKTSIPGVFAAGDVQDSVYRQAVTAAGQGCMAALDAEKFLSE